MKALAKPIFEGISTFSRAQKFMKTEIGKMGVGGILQFGLIAGRGLISHDMPNGLSQPRTTRAVYLRVFSFLGTVGGNHTVKSI